MLSKKRRLSRARNAPLSTKRPRVFSARGFVLSVYDQTGPTLFSCMVSKKISKSATSRNRLRRKMYSVLEKVLPRIKDGSIIVVSVRSASLLETDNIEILKDIEALLEKACLI